jgi:uncharacterized protein (TIGR02001 family)
LIVAERIRMSQASVCACAVLLVVAPPGRCQSDPSPFGGTLAATSDYIYRGVSESDGQGALQADLHASTAGGTFAGVWASTRDRDLEPRTPGEVQLYLGQRFALGGAWTATLSGRADYFVGGSPYHSDDYQEIAAALSWADRCTFSVAVIPSAVRYTLTSNPGNPPHYTYEFYRSAAFMADASGQWLLRQGRSGGALYATAGAGYYYASRPSQADDAPGTGYLYANAGLALQWRGWRIDLGYFAAQGRASQLFPYPVANRLAGTVSWQF